MDGADITGLGNGGDCQIEFGNHGKVCEMEISWGQLERVNPYHPVSPETILKWMREGKAVQNIIFTNVSSIDWATVQSVAVHDTRICYHGQSGPASQHLLIPYVALDTTVDTGERKIIVELDCPVIDQTKP